ncbi:hypothetical protein [Acidithiobacillus sulfurivorans]|uniref:hypothetical protein n=1 Tax=Acidithiobacillus sulfurivorans TaxID=1958756 RepID=UPI001C07BCB6|nr:hypothetical protein [Acidithiobacillus sulfurivorans]
MANKKADTKAAKDRGELPRGDAASIVGTGERQARRVVSALIDHGVVTAGSTRAPLRLNFPATLASRWMPGLFPEMTIPHKRTLPPQS